MNMQGHIIEYLDNGRIICALTMEESNKKLRLLNQNGRELNLPTARVVSRSTVALPGQLSREEITSRLKTAAETRQTLAETIDLAEIWELATTENENIFEPGFLAELYFGSEIDDDRVSAFLRAIFVDRLFFKYKNGAVIAHSPEVVEKNRLCREKEKQQEALLEKGAKGLAGLREGQEPHEWPERQTCLEMLAEYYLHDTDYPEYKTTRELLKRAGISAPHGPYHLLTKAGFWQPHQNIPLMKSEIPTVFSEAAMTEVRALVIPEPEALIKEGVKDFRHLNLLTIDGERTRDFDDGLHLERQGDNYMVGIHIADVAYFVRPETHLFEEARQRGTSIYFAEGATPMLPKEISEGICSLKAGEPRMAMSFMVKLSPQAEVLDYDLVLSLVTVKRQLTYPQVDGMLATDAELADLAELSEKLRDRRLEADALIMPFPDVNITLGPDDEIAVSLSDSDTPSRTLVAEFMILANSLGAKYLVDREIPGLFRSQPRPRQRLIHGLEKNLFINARQRKKLSPMALSTSPKFHSGIGAPQYTTVTSPIRRLLDLVMQLQLRHLAMGRGPLFYKNELLNLSGAITGALSKANTARYQRHRYWLFKHLETRKGERVDGLIIDKGPRRIHVLLTDFMLDADLPANQAISARPGAIIKVRIAKVDALDNVLRIEF